MGSTTIAEVSFRHAFYLVRDVRVADIRVAWLVYLACLRSHMACLLQLRIKTRELDFSIWATPK